MKKFIIILFVLYTCIGCKQTTTYSIRITGLKTELVKDKKGELDMFGSTIGTAKETDALISMWALMGCYDKKLKLDPIKIGNSESYGQYKILTPLTHQLVGKVYRFLPFDNISITMGVGDIIDYAKHSNATSGLYYNRPVYTWVENNTTYKFIYYVGDWFLFIYNPSLVDVWEKEKWEKYDIDKKTHLEEVYSTTLPVL